MAGGSLETLLLSSADISVKQMVTWCNQAIKGLKHLHASVSVCVVCGVGDHFRLFVVLRSNEFLYHTISLITCTTTRVSSTAIWHPATCC